MRALLSTALICLLLAGCSGEKNDTAAPPPSQDVSVSGKQGVRKDFLIIRELVKQHRLQQGNNNRIKAVEASLKEKFPVLPDKGSNEEECRIYQEAKFLFDNLAEM